jgi:hypothetical protein
MDSTQVLINSLMSANSVDELKNRLIPLLTIVAEAAPSGGLTNVTSSSLTITTPSTGVRNIEGIAGDYEPTITNEVGLSSTSVTAGFYSRSGNIVTASFTIELSLAALSTNCTLNFSLPILPASNFSNSRKLTGVYSVNNGLLSNVNLGILSSTSGAKTASFELNTAVAAVSVGLNIGIQYSLV